MDGLTINITEYPLKNGKTGKLAVFLYYGLGNPARILDRAVNEFVGKCKNYCELASASRDNPWMRVVISDVNNIKQEVFDSKIHNLKKTKTKTIKI